MAIIVTRLVQDNVSELMELVNSRPSFSGISNPAVLERLKDQQTRRTFNMLDPNVLKHGMLCIYGAWQNGVLVGAMYTAISEHQACYYITRAYTRPGCNGASVLGALVKTIISDHEEMGYYRFLTVYLKDNLAKYQRLLHREAKGYTSYTEVEVPSNAPVSQLELWEKLYGRTLIPHVTVVRTFVKPTGDVRC